MQHFDVVILGAGPAGAATALALRKAQPQLSLVLVEASDYLALRPGETLPAEAATILQELDVFEAFMEQAHQRVGPGSSAWASPTGALNELTDVGPNGGWQIDRSRFDGMLAGTAAISGVAFIRSAFADVQIAPGGNWQLTLRYSSKELHLNAGFVVDATGRGARFASQIGVTQVAHDTLVGVVRVVDLEPTSDVGRGVLIEAFEHGWWHSLPLPGNRLVLTAMTDADISKRLRLTELAQWSEQLNLSPLTQQRAAHSKISGEQCVRAAHTRSLHAYSGRKWLAVGDAATSIDPLASGILRALRFGIHASAAVVEHFSNNEQRVSSQYESLLQAEFHQSLTRRTDIYRLQTRWENSAFWARRHNPPLLPSPGSQERGSTLSLANGGSTNSLRRKQGDSVPPVPMR